MPQKKIVLYTYRVVDPVWPTIELLTGPVARTLAAEVMAEGKVITEGRKALGRLFIDLRGPEALEQLGFQVE